MLDTLKDAVFSVGELANNYARRVGPKRGIIAFAIMAGAVGTAFVVRHLRGRGAERAIEAPSGGARTKKQRRKARMHRHAMQPG